MTVQDIQGRAIGQKRKMSSRGANADERMPRCFWTHLLLCYVAFGAIHELLHISAAWTMGVWPIHPVTSDGVLEVLGRTLLMREFILPLDGEHGRTPEDYRETIDVIRHAGWVGSVLLALLLHCFISLKKDRTGDESWEPRQEVDVTKTETTRSNIRGKASVFAAYLTALEALCTDLFLLPPSSRLNLVPNVIDFILGHGTNGNASPNLHVSFFCGNFGIILIGAAWMANSSDDSDRKNKSRSSVTKAALDVLERMVQITMMRGAQSGGVITYEPSVATSSGLVGVRSRVINHKRTDLSKRLRSRIEYDDTLHGMKDNFRRLSMPRLRQCTPSSSQQDDERFVRLYCGHTRFATSSKSTLSGTHPHRWCPPTERRVYSFRGHGQAIPTDAELGERQRQHQEDFMEKSVQSLSSHRGRVHGVPSPATAKAELKTVENYITHNGDFEFYQLNGIQYSSEAVHKWLPAATNGVQSPSATDSAAIAGLMDIIRTQGCFALSVRFAICLGLPTSHMNAWSQEGMYPSSFDEYEKIGSVFEKALGDLLLLNAGNGGIQHTTADGWDCENVLEYISDNPEERGRLVQRVLAHFDVQWDTLKVPESVTKFLHPRHGMNLMLAENSTIDSGEERLHHNLPPLLEHFVTVVVDAFFDNDLLQTMKIFLSNAKGSFGLCMSSSLDAHRQICLAARGQTMSLSFHPKTGLICYGSEQAAVKAGLLADPPFQKHGAQQQKVEGCFQSGPSDKLCEDEMNQARRLDLDDLGGEICLLDWGNVPQSIGEQDLDVESFDQEATGGFTKVCSPPNRSASHYRLMNDSLTLVLVQESKITRHEALLYHRMTLLEGNEFISPPLSVKDDEDLVQADIRDIPRICNAIQKDWKNQPEGSFSLNRLTAWNFARCLRTRLQGRVNGNIDSSHGTVDILLTGCEVSLWVAEQFASDLRKAFPRLGIMTASSNKLLGLFGQGRGVGVPAEGHPLSTTTHDFHDTIVIIVSHSGGTFGPLHCSSLLQSQTRNLFVVTSEWDTQVGKQLRNMRRKDDSVLTSRIFTTGVGVRPAEPCSVSVAATQQLLTNLFQHIAAVILSDVGFRRVTGALVSERDLQMLERCNQESISSLEKIVGYDSSGKKLENKKDLVSGREIGTSNKTELDLRAMGDLWADHILENARAYIMTFVYIMVTVVSGYPLVTGLATSLGLTSKTWGYYVCHTIDAFIYFWLPQINVILLRLFQRRNLIHRMVGRTVVVADCPWVAQAADAFLSKIFACSYSIAGINVLSGNPADHLVHRHTHRVCRGTLLVCGRPDGRLSALTNLEATVCLSVNQASSIQSMGGTCESITIGHNPSMLPLSAGAVFLDRDRPLFLCEQILKEKDFREGSRREDPRPSTVSFRPGIASKKNKKELTDSQHLSATGRKRRSSASLLGAYSNLHEESEALKKRPGDAPPTVSDLVDKAINDRKGRRNLRKIFDKIDTDRSGLIDVEKFIAAYKHFEPPLSREQAMRIFEHADKDASGSLDFDEFIQVTKLPQMDILDLLETTSRNDHGLIDIVPSQESYFGENDRMKGAATATVSDFGVEARQHLSMELYESRIASLERFVAMTVMFHQMGKRVQEFFPRISFGILGYRMDRTHSIMRIATTASPVSGSAVRERMETLRLQAEIDKSVKVITFAWRRYKKERASRRLQRLESIHGARLLQSSPSLAERSLPPPIV